ncbi:MAG: ribonuclease R, partial [Hungatella sp.]
MTEEVLKGRKEMLFALIQDKTYVPMKIKELAMLLDVPKQQRNELKEVLDSLVADGKVGISKKGKYGKPETFALVGTFCGHPKGFGFVAIEGMDQ